MSKQAWGIYTNNNTHPGFSIDCVLLSYHKGKIVILLNKFPLNDFWSLPGGFMLKEENAEHAAHRILKTKTGLESIFLKQFYLFSDVNRTILDQNIEFIKTNPAAFSEVENGNEWFLQRFISLGYYALVRYEDVVLSNTQDEDQAVKWFNVDKLPSLYSDHKNIIETALNMMPSITPIISIAYKLLPEKFTITDLRKIYEKFLDKELDRRNFQRKIESLGYVRQLDERQVSKAYNPPFLYSFNIDIVENVDNQIE